MTDRARLTIASLVNAAGISGSDMPHQVVEKLERALSALRRESAAPDGGLSGVPRFTLETVQKRIDAGDIDGARAEFNAGIRANFGVHPPAATEGAGWVSVEERLPEIDVVVLTCRESGFDGRPIYAFGARVDEGDGWLWGISDQRNGCDPAQDAHGNDVEVDDDYKVTHWMPLPAAPPAKHPSGEVAPLLGKQTNLSDEGKRGS